MAIRVGARIQARAGLRPAMKLSALLLPLFLFALGGCGESHTLRYKLTLEAESHGRTVTGSTVVEVRTWLDRGTAIRSPTSYVQTFVRGEALVLPIDDGRLLVATLRSHDFRDRRGQRPWKGGSPTTVLAKAYAVEASAASRARASTDGIVETERDILLALKAKRGPRDIPFESLPDLVTFADPLDPASVTFVDPGNLRGAFGERVRLKRATIEDGGHVIKCQNHVDDCSKKNESFKFPGQVYP